MASPNASNDSRGAEFQFARVVGAWPWIALGSYVLSALSVRASFGRWSVVYLDNPRGMLAEVADDVSFLSIFSTAVVVPVALVNVLLRRFASRRPIVDLRVVSGVCGSLAFYLLLRADPHGYLTWLLD